MKTQILNRLYICYLLGISNAWGFGTKKSFCTHTSLENKMVNFYQ